MTFVLRDQHGDEHSKTTTANATSRNRPNLRGTVNEAQGPARCSSACRSTSPATCTTTSDSNTTACCCRGRCRRGHRSIRRSSGSRCTSRIIRSTTATFEGVIPEGLRRGHRHALGSRHVEARDRGHRRGAGEGGSEVHARRLQAEGLVGARPHARVGIRQERRFRKTRRPERSFGRRERQLGRSWRPEPQLAPHQASRRVERRRRCPRHHHLRAEKREDRRRLCRHRGDGRARRLALQPPREKRRRRRSVRPDPRAGRCACPWAWRWASSASVASVIWSAASRRSKWSARPRCAR